MRDKKLLILILFCCFALIAQDKFAGAKTLKIGLMQDIAHLYPWNGGCMHLETDLVMQNIYETLFRIKEGNTEIEPWLATNAEASPDYKTWTIKLRRGVKLHDGKEFNADAVIASFLLHPIFQDKVKKVDNYTVKFILDEPDKAFLSTLAKTCYSMVSPLTEGCFAWGCKKPVFEGTGPYKFHHWTLNKEVVLTANKKYWNDKPFF